MSRVAKNPVVLPKGVEVSLSAAEVAVKGPLGALSQPIAPGVQVKQDGEKLVFDVADESQEANAMSGTMRALVNNMVTGVTRGFERRLALVGVGYRAQAQ